MPRNCIYDLCNTRSSYNIEGEKTAIYCSIHKLDGMLNVISNTCVYEKCKTRPTYNFKDEQNNVIKSIENLVNNETNKTGNNLKDICDKILEDFENIIFADMNEYNEFTTMIIERLNNVQYYIDNNEMHMSFCAKLMKKFKID